MHFKLYLLSFLSVLSSVSLANNETWKFFLRICLRPLKRKVSSSQSRSSSYHTSYVFMPIWLHKKAYHWSRSNPTLGFRFRKSSGNKRFTLPCVDIRRKKLALPTTRSLRFFLSFFPKSHATVF